ncbi:hypothetical protein GCM10027168_08210 [Streptomyces capparidis]
MGADGTGIENERLVHEYLSRVGDLARVALPAERRRELVVRLREEIERARAEEEDGPAGVRRVLGRLGSPDAVVEAEVYRRVAEGVPPPFPGDGLAPPFPGDTSRPGPALDPEWWRVPDRGAARNPLLDPPDDLGLALPAPRTPPDGAKDTARQAKAGPLRRLLRRPRDGAPGTPSEGGTPSEDGSAARPARGGLLSGRGLLLHWREVAAAGLLVGGTVAGSWLAVLVGWLLAYYSARLTRAEAQMAAVGIPAASAAAAAVYLWGRAEGRWGEPLPEDRLRPVLEDLLPVMVRVAALGSALFLLWRAHRRSRAEG